MKKVKDGWHTFHGLRVWVEKNKVKYADAGKYGYGHIYRRVDGNWVQAENVTVSTFWRGIKFGYISVLMGGREESTKKFRVVDSDENVLWCGDHCPMSWKVTSDGNGKTVAWYETRKEALSAVADAVGKNTCVTIEEVWGAK